MKFVVSSTELLSSIQSIGKVVGSKNTIPILDNFLFRLHNNNLSITASDLDTTLTVTLNIDNVEQEGDVAIPAKLLTDSLREFPDLPLTIIVDPASLMAEVSWATGKFNIPCSAAEEYPQPAELSAEKANTFSIESGLLSDSISKTIFATADDELRPTMNGVYFDFKEDGLTFVASDAHKLVRYRLVNFPVEKNCSFILPKKPANLIKNLLGKESTPVSLEFDDKNAIFTFTRYKVMCRLIEGLFPAYNSVIPKDNPNKITIDRVDFLTAVRRVSTFSNPASNLVKLKIAGNSINISAQDLDFSISAEERINCQYAGTDMEIGFKSSFLVEILTNLPSPNVNMELSDPARAGLFLPFEKEDNAEGDLLMLLMPMVIGV